MLVQLKSAADYLNMPWKNGGGTTSEVARDKLEEQGPYGWRVSIAAIDQGGDFSSFQGYRRIISVIEGAGMRLAVDDVDSGDLLAYDAFVFDGAAQVSCELLAGSIRDLNLIYDPLKFAARLQWLELDTATRFHSSAPTLLAFNASPQSVELHANGERWLIESHGTLVVSELRGLVDVLIPQAAGHLCVIELSDVN
ncbi:MAG: HutD family protein [Pseudomonas sp.]